tara:strand:- start:164 stop:556 length:393 start_codon:yes stop_codon:yes gene_type:complete
MSKNKKVKFDYNTYTAVIAVLLESVKELDQLHYEVLQEKFRGKDIPASARKTTMMPAFAVIFTVIDEFSQFFSVQGDDFDPNQFKGFFLDKLFDFLDEDVYKDFPQQAFGMMGLASGVPEPTHDEHKTVQ